MHLCRLGRSRLLTAVALAIAISTASALMPVESFISPASARAQAFAIPAENVAPGQFEFTRMLAHWSDYGHPDYLPFIEDTRSELVQVGFYGAHYWSLAHTPQSGGYPANFPVRGLDEMGDWFEHLNRELHARHVKVVGHFNVEFLVGDPVSPAGPRGFFKFYRELWDEQLLGPRPVDDPLELLEKNGDGAPIENRSYSIGGMGEYWACLRNPAWRQVLKAWVRHGIQRGVDGYVTNYFYRHNCLCEHCQHDFREYLRNRFSAEELHEQFGIADIDNHRFAEIVAWHAPGESTPLRREMLRFSQISNKQAYDDVFVQYGRSLKPDLLLAQWNHLGDFAQLDGDERCLLPDEFWGRDETYAWYSTGDLANKTDLRQGILGEATLQARYVRGAMQDRPFTLGKYESTRIRAAIAELAANGGAPMGFYATFTDPLARAEIVRYYQFLARHDDLFRGNRSHAEVLLLFPRRAVQGGDVAAVDSFRQLGRSLLDSQVLFDVLPDDKVTADSANSHRAVVSTDVALIALSEVLPADRSRFEAPATVRVSASRPAGSENEIDVHFVNYNRAEPPPDPDGKPQPGRGIVDEQPIAASGINVDLRLPSGARVRAVHFITPEATKPRSIESRQINGRLQFHVPEFLVYGIAQIQFE